MRVVALLAVRNEEYYIERCLRHLYEQNIETCIIDNESTDRTLDIAREFTDRGVFRIESFPFSGIYKWIKILEYKSRLANEIDADWFIHHDADEIREAPKGVINLVKGIQDADKKGYNAINSDELVFTPISEDETFEQKDYVKEMIYYYYFRPKVHHRVNIWKKSDGKIDLSSTGGHSVLFENRKIYPINFILRHYILLSKKHAIMKYGERNYDPDELAKGMNVKRANFNPNRFQFPEKSLLKKVSSFGEWDLSDPWTEHYFLKAPA